MTPEVNTVKPKLLFVDDELPILKSLTRFGRSKSWDVTTVNSGAEGISAIEAADYDVIVSDMRMPGMSGAEFLTRAMEIKPSAVRILLTGYSDLESLQSAINDAKIHSYITKPWDDFMLGETIDGALRYSKSEKERLRLLALTKQQNKKLSGIAQSLDRQVKERTAEIEQLMSMLELNSKTVETTLFESLTVLNHITEWKEGRDSGHSRFVATYTEKVAQALEMTKVDAQNTKIAAMLHQIGSLALPDKVRSKPLFQMDAEELEQYKQMPTLGETALTSAPSLAPVAKIIRHQSEWVNGNGYPDRLTDRDIPLSSKILKVVADFYDLYNGRLERNISGLEEAKTFMSIWKAKKYDTKVTDAFFNVLGDFGQTTTKVSAMASRDLKAGLELESDIVTKSGMLLLKTGTTLSESHIEKIIIQEKKFDEKFVIRVIVNEA